MKCRGGDGKSVGKFPVDVAVCVVDTILIEMTYVIVGGPS